MSDEEKNAGDAAAATAAATVPTDQPFLDEHTTEPNAPSAPQAPASAPAGKWEMPKPKFQQTSGYLPQGYIKDMEAAAEASKTASAGSEDTTQEQAAYVPQAQSPEPAVPAIEPQPDLSDQLIPADISTEAAVPSTPKKGGSRAVAVIFALLAILAFVALFLAAVYFLFLAKPAESQF